MTPPVNYAAAHPTIRISSKRFRFSPFAPCYAKPDTVWGVYSGRLYALSWGDDPNAAYNKLRQEAMLYDVPEHPIEFAGPDATKLCQRLFCRRMENLSVGRARYAIACRHDGGILMDGILLHLAQERYWYVMADGEFLPWVYAQASGLDVTIRDPDSSIVQIQGPRAFDVLSALWEPEKARSLPYFHVRELTIAGVPLLVSRTGWTGEMGFELYTRGAIADGPALWNHLLEVGRPFGLGASGLDSMGVRRIEAGILDNGTDIDAGLTPYQAGLGAFVDLGATDFIGREALAKADQRPLLFGLKAKSGVPLAGMGIHRKGEQVGRITAGGYSPTLKQGIGYARFGKADEWLGAELQFEDRAGLRHEALIVALPFYDAEKRIPRGLSL